LFFSRVASKLLSYTLADRAFHSGAADRYLIYRLLTARPVGTALDRVRRCVLVVAAFGAIFLGRMGGGHTLMRCTGNSGLGVRRARRSLRGHAGCHLAEPAQFDRWRGAA